MKRVAIIILMLAILLTSACTQEKSGANPISDDLLKKLNNVVIDKDYMLAVNSVDIFLSSWLMRNPEKGRQYITEDLASSLKEEELQGFFSGLSNPHHQGYEVIGGEKINNEAIRFYVWMYEYYTGTDIEQMPKPKPYYIDVVKSGKDKFGEDIWLVNSLPVEMK